MRPSRPVVASLVGLGLGVAGCDTVSTSSITGGEPNSTVSLLPHDVALLVLAASLATFGVIVASIAFRAMGHQCLVARLHGVARPTVIDGRPVAIVPGSRVALVAGIRRPRTFLSTDVLEALTDAELAAVVVHERHHELRRAPAALIVLQGIAAVLGWIPPIARLLERRRARIEIDADAHALSRGSTRQAIAGAIVKLGGPPMVPVSARFGDAADLRMRALVDRDTPPTRTWRDDLTIIASLAGVVVVVCSALPV